MAKCIGSRPVWKVNKVELDDKSFLTDIARAGENVLNIRIDQLNSMCKEISRDFFKIRNNARHEDDTWDCYQVQDDIISKLDNLLTEVPSVINHIMLSDLMTVTKHRYFLHFSNGVIEKIKLLLKTIGRLGDLDHKIYLEEQRKPLISEESIMIHLLIEIWSACVEILNYFRESAEEIFKGQLESEEYSFIKQSDFYIAGSSYAKTLLMDLSMTAFLQFNRLVRYDDFLKGLTFLCPCCSMTFTRTLRILLNNGEEGCLFELFPLLEKHLIDNEIQIESIRESDSSPLVPNYLKVDVHVSAYFQLWYLYSFLRILKNEDLQILSKCESLILKLFDDAMKQFKPPNENARKDFSLSPNQEEKFRLVFAMLDKWCETYPKSTSVILKMFTFFETNWNLYGEKYFDQSNCRVAGLTFFQLFTKLVYEAIPIRVDRDGHAASQDNNSLTIEERKLDDVWSKLLDRVTPKNTSNN